MIDRTDSVFWTMNLIYVKVVRVHHQVHHLLFIKLLSFALTNVSVIVLVVEPGKLTSYTFEGRCRAVLKNYFNGSFFEQIRDKIETCVLVSGNVKRDKHIWVEADTYLAATRTNNSRFVLTDHQIANV